MSLGQLPPKNFRSTSMEESRAHNPKFGPCLSPDYSTNCLCKLKYQGLYPHVELLRAPISSTAAD